MITIGITTAPRAGGLLPGCVASLRRAEATDLHVFAEPESDVTNVADVTVHQRDRRFGAWHNWREMCRELLDSSTSPIVLTVQDDTIFSQHALARLVELWPTLTNIGFLSLYTPSHYQRKWCVERRGRTLGIFHDSQTAARKALKFQQSRVVFREYPPGVNRIVTRSLWGACALAFPRDTLKQIINHRIACNWQGAIPTQPPRDPSQIANVDTAIGRICNAMKLSMWFVNPSLAQHAAHHSTLGHGGLGGRRQAWRVADDLINVARGAISSTAARGATVSCCGGR